MKWISVKDKLPQDNQLVIFTTSTNLLDQNHVHCGVYKDINQTFNMPFMRMGTALVPLWLPLPELPLE